MTHGVLQQAVDERVQHVLEAVGRPRHGCAAMPAYTAGRLASSRLYEARASDPMILAGALAIVVTMTVCATLIPARRVSRTDPANALRADWRAFNGGPKDPPLTLSFR